MIRSLNHYINAKALMQVLLDFSIVLGTIAALSLMFMTHAVAAPDFVARGLPLATSTFLVGVATGIYQPSAIPTPRQFAIRALLASAVVAPLAYLFAIRWGSGVVAAGMGYAAVVTVFGVVGYRTVSRYARASSLPRSRVLVVGTGAVAVKVSQALIHANPNTRIVGYFPSPNEPVHAVPEAQILADQPSLVAAAAQAGANEVVVALTERRSGSMSLRDLLDCKINGIRVSDVSALYERSLGQINLEHVNAGWLIFGDGFEQGMWRSALKRVFDLVFATLLLVVTLPLMLLTAIAIALESPGRVLYRQERVGLKNKPFHVIKFRSMRQDAEVDGCPRWAGAADDRITRVGRFIRRMRIDELPQLVNVLRGEMSLVGPRPERPYFVQTLTQHIPYYAVRHSAKPGVTGWAQVRFTYGATVEDAKEKLQYDLYYVKNHSLFLDLQIMFETVHVVLTGKGAR
jgi:sugar transferase (PEP-CTERM system associated)